MNRPPRRRQTCPESTYQDEHQPKSTIRPQVSPPVTRPVDPRPTDSQPYGRREGVQKRGISSDRTQGSVSPKSKGSRRSLVRGYTFTEISKTNVVQTMTGQLVSFSKYWSDLRSPSSYLWRVYPLRRNNTTAPHSRVVPSWTLVKMLGGVYELYKSNGVFSKEWRVEKCHLSSLTLP